MNTAGRTVAYSAVTVSFALITLTVFPLNFLQSMGIAGAVVALVAGVASLVIAPTMFALWGAKLAVRRRRPERAPEQGAWYRLAHAVMRRPLRVAVVTGILMLALALPALRAVWTPVDSSVIPKGESARTVADTLARDYGGQDTNPVVIAIDAPPAERDGVAEYAAGLGDLPGVRAVSKPRPLDDSTWQVDLAVAGDPDGDAAQALVQEIRDRPTSYALLVGGSAAEFVDQQDAIGSNLPLAVGLLVALTLTVLWLMTGSVVLPVKAILMNALTVGSALGVLTLVFQDGRFESALGYTGNGGVEPTDFLVAAALVFALSTDYGVFLLGRIKEARMGGLSEREAVAVGVERTGAVVTAAAILLAVAIGAFITSSISFIQQVGVATAAGVLIDAFVVRALLVPSLMALLGRWNWWSPRPLARLHSRIGFSEAPA
jgi:RND superfamily putative drug exporter